MRNIVFLLREHRGNTIDGKLTGIFLKTGGGYLNSMETVVCIKAVPVMVSGARVTDGGDRIEYKYRSLIMNEQDEYALEEALFLRSKYGGKVTAITVGSHESEGVLQAALAKGADQVIRVDDRYNNAERTSIFLSEALHSIGFNLILTGMESWDNLASQVGVSIGSRLGIPFVFGATGIEPLDAKKVVVHKELGGGAEVVLDISMPLLICLQTGIRPLSYVPFAKLVQAKRRLIKCLSISDLKIDDQSMARKHGFKISDVSPSRCTHNIEFIEGKHGDIAQEVVKIIERGR